ncbi:DUF805 domain-containing protein [Thorsellia anophelis]|uniref:Uncharacterized membrane protein YhaH, DUF805 family n=1 Tax=Thorsellia anophelis DSM 18579 TaxID=1123402 RepID=A0A1I0CUF7_9GAMM|nr:DUF805 domain-containing protein [Thorsellia anophelis]SET23335.1 Uncharacterized membrane protein YhaH, DUF805 family [Thorsellia anophelis DSM 18579]
MNYYINCLKKFATFKGRARRAEFWYFYLYNLIIITSLYLLGGFLIQVTQSSRLITIFDFLTMGYQIIMLLPSIAVSIRRLHDRNKKAWFYLLIFIPILGFIVLLIQYCKEGTKGNNQFGKDPKMVNNE